MGLAAEAYQLSPHFSPQGTLIKFVASETLERFGRAIDTPTRLVPRPS
jgi:hypothetical protein